MNPIAKLVVVMSLIGNMIFLLQIKKEYAQNIFRIER